MCGDVGMWVSVCECVCVCECVEIFLLNLYCFNHSNDRPCALVCECVCGSVSVGVCEGDMTYVPLYVRVGEGNTTLVSMHMCV